MSKQQKPRHLEEPDLPGLAAAVGDVLRTYRRSRKLTQEEFAAVVDMERVYISQIERGIRRPSLGALFKFARALNVEPAELIREVQERL
jgi:transcriptional regulator with XRE-family HTH domain